MYIDNEILERMIITIVEAGQPHQILSNLLRYSTSRAAWYLLLLILSLSL